MHFFITLGRASTKLTSRYSTPTLVGSNSPKVSPTSPRQEHLKKCTSSGQIPVPRPMRSADVSNTSISESGYNSLNASSTEVQLRQLLHQDKCLQARSASQKSTSCPPTPQHLSSSSTSSLPPPGHSSPHLSPSQSHTALAQSKSLGSSPTTSLTEIIQKPKNRANGNMVSHGTSTQVHRHTELPPVPEGSDCLQSEQESSSGPCLSGSGERMTTEICEKLARLTERVEDLAARDHPSPKMTSREVQTDSDGRKRGRVCSDTTAMQMIQRKPLLGKTQKAHSEGDMVSFTSSFCPSSTIVATYPTLLVYPLSLSLSHSYVHRIM